MTMVVTHKTRRYVILNLSNCGAQPAPARGSEHYPEKSRDFRKMYLRSQKKCVTWIELVLTALYVYENLYDKYKKGAIRKQNCNVEQGTRRHHPTIENQTVSHIL